MTTSLALLGAFLTLSPVLPATAAMPPKVHVKICVDETDWWPFTFQEGGVTRGVHVDVAADVLTSLGYTYEFVAMPWARCVDLETKRGRFDVPLSAGFNQRRSSYLYYPENAAIEGPACRSPAAIMCNGNILVVPKDSTYVFKGDLASVPPPIRIIHGYIQADQYAGRGVKVDTGPDDEINLRKMLRDKSGSVLMTANVARRFAENPEFKGQFKIIENYNDGGDSFMPFAKKGQLSKAAADEVFKVLQKKTAESGYIAKFLQRYAARSR